MEVVSRAGISEDAVTALEGALEGLPAAADLVIAFGPAAWIGEGLARRLRERFGPSTTLLGGSASGVIGGGLEVERRPALSLTALRAPGLRTRWIDLDAPTLAEDTAGVLLLATPDAPVEWILERLGRAGATAVVGGLVSGARERGAFRLLRDDAIRREGAVALALEGAVAVDALVAQGCRPVGEPMIVVRTEGNLLLELDVGRPLDALRAVTARLDEADRALLRRALFLGVQMRDQRGPYRPGDFLVRDVVGAEPDRGALTLAAPLDGHPVVQFHVRDARTSAEDLERHLGLHAPGPAGVLMFSCLGRGEGLYGVPHHDADRVAARLLGGAARPTAPIGGLFCNGEIGPVGERSFLHGYTTSLALIRPRRET